MNSLTTSTVTSVGIQTKKDNRFLILFFCAFVQLGVGMNYIWSVFQPYIMKEFGWDSHTTYITYTFSLLAFVIGGSFAGKLEKMLSPKAVIFFSGLVMAGGTVVAGFTPASSPVFLYVTWGGIVGLAMGIIYNTSVTLCQKWFYDKKGFASGVVVSFLGFSGIIFAPIVNYSLSSFGVKYTFIIIGAFFFILASISAIFVKKSPDDYGIEKSASGEVTYTTKQFSPKEMIRTPNFYILILSFTFGIIAFILNNPLLMIIGAERGLSIPVLLTGVMAVSFSNAAGRLLSATMSDIIGRKITLLILYCLSLLCSIGLMFVGGYLLIVLFCLLAFAYGGTFSTLPAITTDSFGMKHASSNYGLVMFGLGLAALMSMLISEIISIMHMATTSRFIASIIFAALGIVLVLLIKKPKQD